MKNELLKFQDEWEKFLSSLPEDIFKDKKKSSYLLNHLSWMQTILNTKLLKAYTKGAPDDNAST